ncbi:MAG: betaine/proline/choline family ABC transporter ATP-binding protein [Solirubrobacteraceae bacterium]
MNDDQPTAAGAAEANGEQPMIRLEGITKMFPGQATPAVDSLSMDFPDGEIIILVGPSGCGKSTTLRLINRLIEPTRGRIFLEGDDVTTVKPDQLRRRMGYVIQQIGLFPHMTIADNIATVPKMLGWDKRRIAARVTELLATVGMDPDTYRRRYPKELSGGQAQRVGVARAMAADPPILLMDEPFGAIDPITRDRLQNEFLRLQADIRKTIVFVTHDIDEAIKMGDRIAILQQGSQIAQYDTPERILTNPANDFVEAFIGHGASLKGLTLAHVTDVELSEWPVVRGATDRSVLRERLLASDKGALLVLDGQGRPHRWLTVRDLDARSSLDDVGLPAEDSVLERNATLHDALDLMITSYAGAVVVVDDDRRYLGVIELDTIRNRIDEIQAAAQQRYRKEPGAVAPQELAP